MSLKKIKVSFFFDMLLFFILLCNIETIYFKYYDYVRYISFIVLSFFILKNYKVLVKFKYFKLNLLVILFSLYCILITQIKNPYIDYDFFPGTMLFICKICIPIFYFEIACNKYRIKRLFCNLKNFTLMLCLITDFLIICIPSLGTDFAVKYSSTLVNQTYLVGNKFSVSFLHLALLMLYSISRKTIKFDLKFLLISSLSIFISYYVNCATGLIANIILSVFYVYNEFFEKILKGKKIILINMAFSGLFIMLVDLFINSGIVQNIIVNVLHRDITLTGRTIVYSMILKFMKTCPVTGYGYGSSVIIIPTILGFSNCQNAFWDLAIQIGLFGILFIILLIIISPSKGNFSIVAYLITLILSGTVEITYGPGFIIYIALLSIVPVDIIDSRIFQGRIEE